MRTYTRETGEYKTSTTYPSKSAVSYYDPDHDFSVLIRTLRYIINKSGYDLMGRIELRNKFTGKIYK